MLYDNMEHDCVFGIINTQRKELSSRTLPSFCFVIFIALARKRNELQIISEADSVIDSFGTASTL